MRKLPRIDLPSTGNSLPADRRRVPRARTTSSAALSYAALAAMAALFPSPARALEGNSAFLRGITIGVPIGALPPPGTYFATFATQYAFDFYDAAGQRAGSRIDETIAGAQVLWVPNIPSIFGAT